MATKNVPKALVVEDDQIVRCLVTEILDRAGYAVDEAENGADGIAKCQARQPALVVTDIFMPEQDGIELLRHVKRSHPGVRVVAISGGSPMLPRMDFLQAATKLGADAVLYKPFSPAELLAAVTDSNFAPEGNVLSFSGSPRRGA